MTAIRLIKRLIWFAVALLLVGGMLSPAGVEAAVYWAAGSDTPLNLGVRSRDISVCFVGDATHFQPDRVRQVVEYIHHFENAANIRFKALNGNPLSSEAQGNIAALDCPSPTLQPNGNHYYIGDIRVVIPETGIDATAPLPGLGCDNDQLYSDPDAVSIQPDRIDAFFRGLGDTIRQRVGTWDEDNQRMDWSGMMNLGGEVSSGPSVASDRSNRMHVFARGPDGTLKYLFFNGQGWSLDWRDLGGSLAEGSSPDAVGWGGNRLDVFVRWANDHLYRLSSTDGGLSWNDWEDLGGVITSGPTVTTRTTNRLDVFARGPDMAVWHRTWTGSSWTNWVSIGGSITSDPDAISPAANRFDVFARGQNDHLWTNRFNGSRWSGWVDLGSFTLSGPGAAAWSGSRIHVLAAGPNGALWEQYWTHATSSWSSWADEGVNSGWGSWSNPPWVLDLPERRACLYNMKLGNDPWNATPYLDHTLHEFGHALGLAHEHERADAKAAEPSCTDPRFGGDITAGLMTPYDRLSVMNYEFMSCNISGNYGYKGLSLWDQLALHILYPDDLRRAEFIGRLVLPRGDTLNLQSQWKLRGANMDYVADNFEWSLDGAIVSHSPELVRVMDTPGVFELSLSHDDFLDRHYTSSVRVRVLTEAELNNLIAITGQASPALFTLSAQTGR